MDIFRAFAIIPVVIYHFNVFLPFGYLGVDLFFVISGLLVGSILIRKFKRNERIGFWRFILQRGFKIWPSYYTFLIAGTLLAILFYSESKPGYIINGGIDALRYVFFYQNYTSTPYHWPFDHVWSLCIEEHFYILLPIMMIVVVKVFGNKKRALLFSVAGLILAGILFKIISYYLINSKDIYSGTHNRIDALGWGVLLGVLVTYYDSYLRSMKNRFLFFIAGLLVFSVCIFLFLNWKSIEFQRMAFHSIAPFSFFLMLLGVYYTDFSAWKPLRFISYYSYNWYLWHPVFVLACSKFFGITWWGLILYMLISFFTAMIFTILIEETFLSKREAILARTIKK